MGREILREAIDAVVRLLNPFAPHMSEELWRELGYTSLLTTEPWRDHDPLAVDLDVITIVVQVNGKLRANISVAKELSKQEIEQLAASDPRVASYLAVKSIVRTVVVPGKLVNFVVK